jgi:hypothetical protein
MLYDVTRVHCAFISRKWSPGVYHGLMDALAGIEAAGGAYVDDTRTAGTTVTTVTTGATRTLTLARVPT